MGRGLTIAVTGEPSMDAHKALLKRIELIEEKYDRDPASVTDLTTAKVVLTGADPYKIHVFTFTNVKATGAYTCAFVESVPNADKITPAT